MDYLDYEATLPHVKKTYYDGFKFLTMDKVADQIKKIPEQPYGQKPDGSPADSEMPPSEPSTGCKMSSHETARMNKVSSAKPLLLGDTRKAQAISDFVKAMFMRDLVPIADTTQNCLYEAFLQQISNSDFMYHPDTGETYSPMDLRTQLLYVMVTDYEEYYPKVQMHLEVSYKQWLYDQMDEASASDLVAVSALRHFFQVSKK